MMIPRATSLATKVEAAGTGSGPRPMASPRHLALGAAVLVIAGFGMCGALLWARTNEKDDLARELRALRQDVARLEQRSASESVRLLSVEQAAHGVSGASEAVALGARAALTPNAADLEKDDESPPPGSDTALADPGAPDGDELAVHVTNAFDAEVFDPTWSRSAETQATRALTEHLPAGSSIQSIQCRSTLCQVRWSHADREAYAQLMRAVSFSGSLWNGAFATFTNEQEGRLEVVTFIGKEGAELPLLQNE